MMPIDRKMLDEISKHLLTPISRRIANTAARCTVQMIDNGGGMQLVQIGVLDGETVDSAERYEPHGLTSVPDVGAEGVVIFPNGDRAHPLVVVVADRRYRPRDGEPGDVILYGKAGARVTMKANGDIEAVPAAGHEVRIGAAGASHPPALASELADLKSRINTWTPVANDGGASLKGVFSAWPVPGATKVKID